MGGPNRPLPGVLKTHDTGTWIAMHDCNESGMAGLGAAHGSALLRRLQNHRASMAPHQKERHAGKLLLDATAEIDRLIGICSHVHDRMLRGDSDMELMAKLAEGWRGPNH
jgi:hypothetical protein